LELIKLIRIINIGISYMIKVPIYPFLTGGLIVGGAKFVSEIANPLWASLLGAIPNDMITPYFLDTDANKKIYIIGYILQSIIFIFVIASLYLLLRFTKINPDLLILLAIITWFICSFYLVRSTKSYIEHYFTKN